MFSSKTLFATISCIFSRCQLITGKDTEVLIIQLWVNTMLINNFDAVFTILDSSPSLSDKIPLPTNNAQAGLLQEIGNPYVGSFIQKCNVCFTCWCQNSAMQSMLQCLQSLSFMDYALIGQLIVSLGSLNELSSVIKNSSIANLDRKYVS